MELTKKYLDNLTFDVIGAAIAVQNYLGKGLLESVYHECLKEELTHRKINFQTELKVPLIYRGKEMAVNFKCDLFIENCLVVELKAVSELKPIFDAQLYTYMNLLKVPKGLLINFNSDSIFYGGQKTLVNHYFKNLK